MHCKIEIFFWKGCQMSLLRDKNKILDNLAKQCDKILEHDYEKLHNESLNCIHLPLCLKYNLINYKKIVIIYYKSMFKTKCWN